MRHAYEALLHLYPVPYRLLFGREMTTVFEQVTGDYKSRGLLAYSMFLGAEFAGLIAGAFSVWTDEYMRRTARRRWLTPSVVVSAVAGLAVTAFFQGFVYRGLAGHRPRRIPSPEELPQAHPQIVGLLALIGLCLVLISVLSLAFVWNMRTIGNRARGLKPIWMPGRADARTIRNSGRHRYSPGRGTDARPPIR